MMELRKVAMLAANDEANDLAALAQARIDLAHDTEAVAYATLAVERRLLWLGMVIDPAGRAIEAADDAPF